MVNGPTDEKKIKERPVKEEERSNQSSQDNSLSSKDKERDRENYPWTIECFLEDLFLGGQSSIILVNRRLSVKFLPDI